MYVEYSYNSLDKLFFKIAEKSRRMDANNPVCFGDDCH